MARAVVAGLALIGAAGVALDHARHDVYAIPTWGVVLTVVLLVGGLGGVALWFRHPAYGGIVFAAAALIAFGVLAILSFGILALGAGLALVTVAARRRGSVAAGIGAALSGAALTLLVVFALGDPVVDCTGDGAESGENFFMAIGSSGEASASGSDSPDGTASGSAQGSNYVYSYECRGDELTKFTFRWR